MDLIDIYPHYFSDSNESVQDEIQEIQEIVQESEITHFNIQPPINANQRRNYEDRCRFFNNMFRQDPEFEFNTFKLMEIFQGRLAIKNIPNLNIKMFLKDSQLPSLIKLKLFLLPPLFYDNERYELTTVLKSDMQNLVQDSLDDVVHDILPGEQDKGENHFLGQKPIYNINGEYNGSELHYSKMNLSNIIKTIQDLFISGKVGKVLLEMEILYADFYNDIRQQNIQNLQQEQEQINKKIIRYQRAWANIDKYITQFSQFQDPITCENMRQIQRNVEHQFFQYDPNDHTLFQLRNVITPNPMYWRRRFRSMTFISDPARPYFQEQDDADQTKVMIFNLKRNRHQIKRVHRNIISNIIDNMERLDILIYTDATTPVFIRSINFFIIKEFQFSERGANMQMLARDNPQAIQQIINRALNGLVAFNFGSQLYQQYDLLLQSNIPRRIVSQQQHCLFRIIYYFEVVYNDLRQSFQDYIKERVQQQNFLDKFDFQKQFNPHVRGKVQMMKLQQKIFYGCVYDFVQFIKDRFNIILGIYIVYSSIQLFEDQQYHLIISNNHCVLTDKQQLYKLKQSQQKKNQYIMYSVENQQKAKKKKKIIQKPLDNHYIDTETYTDQSLQKVYLICSIDQDNQKQYFSDIHCVQNYVKYLKDLIDQKIYSQDGRRLIIWAFNGSKFDYLFLIDEILKRFTDVQILGSNSSLKQIQINNCIFFKDIRLIFTRGSLDQQAKIWGINCQKDKFDIKNWTLQMYRDEQNFRKVLKYCFQDCLVLKCLVEKLYELVNIEYSQCNINREQKIEFNPVMIFSASSFAMSLFRQFYLQHNLESQKSREIYNIERSSFYGGVTINFQKKCNTGVYLDINSAYPDRMANLKMPIRPASGIRQCFQGFGFKDVDEYFLYEIDLVFFKDTIVPIFPTRVNEGLIYPLEVQKSWRWGYELLWAYDNGLIEKINFYQFLEFQTEFIFTEFINNMYKKRQDTERQDLKEFYKTIINSTFGKTSQQQFNKTNYVNSCQLEECIRHPGIQKIQQLTDQTYKIEYGMGDNIDFIGGLVRIASFITMSARIKLFNTIYKIGPKNIVYCDTDSIVINNDGDYKKADIGSRLGQWKLEGFVVQGRFLAPKVYYMELMKPDGEIEFIQKCKGIQKNILTQQILDQFGDKKFIKLINKSCFKRKFGSVQIMDVGKNLRIIDLKRQYGQIMSHPYQNVQQYEQMKLVKIEQNDIQHHWQKYMEIHNDYQKCEQLVKNRYLKRFNQIINQDEPINQKLKQFYMQFNNFDEYFKDKILQLLS